MLKLLARPGVLLVGTLLVIGSTLAQTDLRSEDVIARRGGSALTVGMMDQRMNAIPEDVRSGYLDDPGRMTRMIDVALTQVQLAAEARKQGITLPPEKQTGDEIGEMDALAAILLEQSVESLPESHYEALAQERYRGNKKAFSTEPVYVLQHLMVNSEKYGAVAAKIVADNALKRAKAGENFDELITKYSDTDDDDDLMGDIPVGKLLRIPTPLLDAIKKLGGQPGFTDVVQGPSGYHIIELVEVKEPEVKPYEDIREDLIAELRHENEQSTRVAYMKTFIQQPTDLNHDVVGRLFTRYYKAEDNTH